MASKKRRTLADAFGGESPRKSEHQSSEAVNTVREHSMGSGEAVSKVGEVEMVPGGRSGEMVPADKPVNMTFTVTAKERYLWTLELKRRGRSAVSVLRGRMNDLMDEQVDR